MMFVDFSINDLFSISKNEGFSLDRITALSINLLPIAAFCTGFVLVAKIIDNLVDEVAEFPEIKVGPLSFEAKKIVSYTLATYGVLKIMLVAGWIFSFPTILTIIAAFSLASLFIFNPTIHEKLFHTEAKELLKPLDVQIKDLFLSKKFENKVFAIPFKNKVYRVRLIHNPHYDNPIDADKGFFFTRYLMAPETELPLELQNYIKSLRPDDYDEVMYFPHPIYQKLPFDLFAPDLISHGP